LRDEILPTAPDGNHHIFKKLSRFAFEVSSVLGPAQCLNERRCEIEIEGETFFLKVLETVSWTSRARGTIARTWERIACHPTASQTSDMRTILSGTAAHPDATHGNRAWPPICREPFQGLSR
jgi:hypothetical protein